MAHQIGNLLATNPPEARQWLQAGRDGALRTLPGWDTSESSVYVDDLYESGATNVFACKIETDEFGDTARLLLIELPKDADAREALFDAEARQAKSFSARPATDVGQDHLAIELG